ncbi:MAG TPA: TraR/DksA family transcriptional regulator [Methylomirabilota bacterium]|nr:TraR/DksA family transcriptional regulator [Methylomirabilota bacterium]
MNTDQVKQALERELGMTASRIRELGSATDPKQHEAIARTDEPPGDPMDRIQTTETREQYFSSKELLTERAERLAGALDRLRDGSYGICVECGEAIGWARLRVIPEATTCVRCQARLEPRQVAPGARSLRAPKAGGDDVEPE